MDSDSLLPQKRKPAIPVASRSSLGDDTRSEPRPFKKSKVTTAGILFGSRSTTGIASGLGAASPRSTSTSFSRGGQLSRDYGPCSSLLSPFERLPTEVLNEIACCLHSDKDLVHLLAACSTFQNALNCKESSVWKRKFLHIYDNADVNSQGEYFNAYRLRQLVLGQFAPFIAIGDKRLVIQLDVLRQMVVETFLPASEYAPRASVSPNLELFASRSKAPWMEIFLSVPLPIRSKRRGQRDDKQHSLFETLQLVFSYLVLSPTSEVARNIPTAREDYDIARVYNWNQPLSTIYRRLLNREQASEDLSVSGLADPQSMDAPQLQEAKFLLEIDTLLHIRNFWHRHLIDPYNAPKLNTRLRSSRRITTSDAESTFTDVAEKLASFNIHPKAWTAALTSPLELAETWHGIYSCLHPWPRKQDVLEERQSCAEDWDATEPLTLRLSISRDNDENQSWPPIFRDIRAFGETIPDTSDPHNGNIYIRGIAPFLDWASLSAKGPSAHATSATAATATDAIATDAGAPAGAPAAAADTLPKHHPYLALRVRGVIHPVAPQPANADVDEDGRSKTIPGWHRICMVLFQPSKHSLIQTLEHNEDNFGSPWSVWVSAHLAAATNTANNTANAAAGAGAGAAAVPANPLGTLTGVAAATPFAITAQAILAQLDEDEIERLRTTYLMDKLAGNREYRDAAAWTNARIAEMEEKAKRSTFMEWEDMEFAYAYEGAVLPGGKIMLGRWWRCGIAGENAGMEVGGSGEVVEAVGEEPRWENMERGPFVFWC